MFFNGMCEGPCIDFNSKSVHFCPKTGFFLSLHRPKPPTTDQTKPKIHHRPQTTDQIKHRPPTRPPITDQSPRNVAKVRKQQNMYLFSIALVDF